MPFKGENTRIAKPAERRQKILHFHGVKEEIHEEKTHVIGLKKPTRLWRGNSKWRVFPPKKSQNSCRKTLLIL